MSQVTGKELKAIGGIMKNRSEQKANFIKRTGLWIKKGWYAIAPGQRAWRGATWGVLVGALFFALITSHSLSVHAGWISMGLGLILVIVTAAVGGGLTFLLIRILSAFPSFYMITFFSAGFSLFLAFNGGQDFVGGHREISDGDTDCINDS